MRLEDIGFYTLNNSRAKDAANRYLQGYCTSSPINRAEILITDKCNLKCPYCRGMENKGELSYSYITDILRELATTGLHNIRISGGEPTIHPRIYDIINNCKSLCTNRIAISTNGTNDLSCYKKLIAFGVNDFSISLDSGCCSIGEKMTGNIKGSWNAAVETIKFLVSYNIYTTIGVVFTEENYDTAYETINFISNLGVSDIRIIPSAQYNKALENLKSLPSEIRALNPILNYRIKNLIEGIPFRGILKNDCHKCWLVNDDIAISGEYHYPCVIYLRERGKPIGKMSSSFREERFEWFKKHDSFADDICRKNCLDVCVDYNNKVQEYVDKIKSRRI